jgi:hypothetical protein
MTDFWRAFWPFLAVGAGILVFMPPILFVAGKWAAFWFSR